MEENNIIKSHFVKFINVLLRCVNFFKSILLSSLKDKDSILISFSLVFGRIKVCFDVTNYKRYSYDWKLEVTER